MTSMKDTRLSKVPFTSKTEDPPPPSFENVLDELGMPGRFQITQIMAILVSMVLASFLSFGYIFQGFTPPHVCNTVNDTELISTYGRQNDSTVRITYGSCDITVSTNQSGRVEDIAKLSCPNGRNFSDAGQTTWISQWDLVCESKGRAELTYTVFSVGQIIGGLISSQINDRFGRKPVYIACCIGAWIIESAIIFAPNIYVIIAMKFVSGSFHRGMISCGYIYGMEFVAPRHRQVYGSFSGILWVFEITIVLTAAYVFRDYPWKYFQGATMVAGIFSFLCVFLLHESPRWLAANGRVDEAVAILRKASKQNKKDAQRIKELFLAYVYHTFPTSTPGALISQDEPCNDEERVNSVGAGVSVKGKRVSVLTLLKHRHLLIVTLISTYIWLTHVLTYFGLYMTAKNLAGDRHLNFLLLALVEIPTCFIVLVLTRQFGRRMCVVICLGVAVSCLVASTLLSTFGRDLGGSGTLTTVFFILGKAAVSTSLCIVYMITPELFPTNLRSTASGVCSSISRVGGMVAPFMAILYDVINWGPGMIFTVMCIFAMVLVMFLPETKGKDLPSTVQETLDQRKKPGVKVI